MKKRHTFAIFILVFCLTSLSNLAENTPIKKANYKLAARFSAAKLEKMVFSTSVDPHWLKFSDRFWYSFETSAGKTFYLVDPVKKTKRPIFDNVKMAAMLTRITKDPYDAKHVPIKEFKFIKKESAIQFEVESSQYEEKKEEKGEEKKEEKEEENGKEEEEKDKKPKKKIFGFEYELATGKLTQIKDYKKPPEKAKWASISPDGETIVFSRQYNLYYMDKRKL